MNTLKTFVFKFANDWTMNLASMIAYNLITAIFPILLAILSITGLVLGNVAPADLHNLAAAINRAVPEKLRQGLDVTALLQSLVHITGPLAVASLIGLVWLGSNLFANMENAFSIIFRVRGRDLVRQRIMALGMVLILGLLLPLSLGAASLVTAGSSDFGHLLPHQLGIVLSYIGPLTSLGVLWLLFMVIYMVVPNFEVRFRQAWLGALVAAILFVILEVLFPLYIQIFLTPNLRYGAPAFSLLALVIFLWFFAVITVVGAQINAVFMGLKAIPFDLARTVELAYEEHDPLAHTKRRTAPTRLKRIKRLLIRRAPHWHLARRKAKGEGQETRGRKAEGGGRRAKGESRQAVSHGKLRG